MRPSGRLDDKTVTRLERLAHEARAAIVASLGSVRDGWSSDARGRVESLRNAVCGVAGAHVADVAVTDWIITDHPIADLVHAYRLRAGVRVRRLTGGDTVGTVQAPRTEAEDTATLVDPVFRGVWVQWDGGEGRELVRAASLVLVAR